MEKILILYEYKNGEEVFFPNGDYAIEIGSFTYNASRMGGSPTISASIMSDIFLDDKWNDNVYTRFNGERYFIKNTPNSTKSNTDVRFKYDLLFVSERIALDNVYFFDVVDSTSNDDKPVSNKSSFSFSGTIHDFSKRLGQSLKEVWIELYNRS